MIGSGVRARRTGEGAHLGLPRRRSCRFIPAKPPSYMAGKEFRIGVRRAKGRSAGAEGAFVRERELRPSDFSFAAPAMKDLRVANRRTATPRLALVQAP
jgi:hypothetical protein